ncbi:kinase-like domain-containing protein [Mycena floridula]|nr:kinase-like domain-containing protein [Mycena floridula]
MVHQLATSFPDFTGATLDDGRYLVLCELGAGSYGKVYQAIDTSFEDQTLVAIKCVVKPEPESDEEINQTREFALHQKVSAHRNIITFQRHFSDSDFVFIVLDLCEGGDLFGAIEQQERFFGTDDQARDAILQLIDGLQYCHQQRVYHRDLKLENILFDSINGQMYLADFGLCTDSRMSVDFGCGTVFYMSPECLGKETGFHRFSTAHADIWALGVLITSIISGRNPWTIALSTDKCFKAFSNDKSFLFKTLPISAGANDILCGLFESDPRARTPLTVLREQIVNLNTFFKTKEEIAEMRRYIPASPPIVVCRTSSFGNLLSTDAERHAQRLVAASPVFGNMVPATSLVPHRPGHQ